MTRAIVRGAEQDVFTDIGERKRDASSEVPLNSLRANIGQLMPLQAFIDDSGTHTNDSPVCVAAGYFGGASRGRRWFAVLKSWA
jgi:hypothetical protein